MKLEYRLDLDGLRAIAVAGVITYHFFPDFSAGGFTGVDVFFVLSGYLITSIVLTEIGAGKFSLLAFYDRRVRRIVPALFVVVLFSLAAAWLLFLPKEFLLFAKSLAAIPLFVTNLVFYREAGYFDSSADIKPLLHTWSLSIEEQFYVFFPVCAVLIARYARRYFLHALIVGGVLSFVLNVLLVDLGKQPAAFFTLPTRAWELLIGAALAEIGLSSRRTLGQAVHCAAGYLGITLILAGFMLIEAGPSFPGWLALVPTLGAALVIWSGGPKLSGPSSVGALLSAKPFVWLGLISYSLYLWHWPLLVFAKYYAIAPLTQMQIVIVLLAAIAMATASYRYIERPFRYPAQRIAPRRSVTFGVSALALAGFAGGLVLAGKGLPQRFEPGVLDLATVSKGAGLRSTPFSTASMTQLSGETSAQTDVVLWGDSHANAISPAVAEMSRSSGFSAVMLKRAGCLPATIDGSPAKDDCKTYTRDAARWIRDSSKAKVVILAGRWSAYQRWWKDDLPKDQGLALLEHLLVTTVEDLRRAGKSVVVLAEVPSLGGWDVPSVLVRIKLFGLDLDIRPDEQDYLEKQKPYLAILDRLAQSGATILFPHSRLCANGKCEVIEGGKALYFDNDHVSVAGALKLAPLFSDLPHLVSGSPTTTELSPTTTSTTR